MPISWCAPSDYLLGHIINRYAEGSQDNHSEWMFLDRSQICRFIAVGDINIGSEFFRFPPKVNDKTDISYGLLRNKEK